MFWYIVLSGVVGVSELVLNVFILVKLIKSIGYEFFVIIRMKNKNFVIIKLIFDKYVISLKMW